MAHLLMLHGHAVGYLPPTYAREILTSDGQTVEDKTKIEDLNVSTTLGNLTGQFKKQGKIAFINGGLDYTTSTSGTANILTLTDVRAKESFNWVGAKVSGNTVSPARGYGAGNKLYSQNVSFASGDGLIINAVFELE